MVEELSLTDMELKRIHNLEFITDIEEREGIKKKIGFSRGRFVILNVEGTRAQYREIPIPELYFVFKAQALKGNYNAAREFLKLVESPVEKKD